MCLDVTSEPQNSQNQREHILLGIPWMKHDGNMMETSWESTAHRGWFWWKSHLVVSWHPDPEPRPEICRAQGQFLVLQLGVWYGIYNIYI